MTSSAPVTFAGTAHQPPSVSRARLSTSLEPSGIAGTSWNSVRWTRPSAGAGHRTSRLANAFEVGGSSCSSSAVSTCSSSTRAHSPFGYSMLRSSERAASAASRPHDGSVIRANSRFGTALLNTNGSSSFTPGTARSSQSAADSKRPIAYRPISSVSQPRATLLDIRQNLRPVKRQTTTGSDYSSFKASPANVLLSPRASFASSGVATPLLFTNSTINNKCIVSPPMSRSSSSVTSPVTTLTPRPIPKSERPWRQKLADAQRLRDAQEERSGRLLPKEPYETTMRLLAAKANRRANAEHQQQEAEQKLEKQIAALKCYVSDPGALDKSATVAKFRQRMAEGQAPSSLTTVSSVPNANNANPPPSSATSLLSRMPSLSRRATSAVTKDSLPSNELKQSIGNRGNRPLSMVEAPVMGRRLSVVKETSVSEMHPEGGAATPPALIEAKNKQKMTGKESPKTPKTTNSGQRPSSRASTASSTSTGTAEKGVTVRKGSPKLNNNNTQQKKGMMVNEERKNVEGGEKKEPTKKAGPVERKLSKAKDDEKVVGKATKKEGGDKADKYNAVVQFRPQSMLHRKEKMAETDEQRPVPGTWQRSQAERCISHNKRLIRRAASGTVAHVHRAVPVVRVSSARMRAPRRVANKCEGAFVNRLAQAHNAAISVKSKSQLPTATVLKMIKSIARPKQRLCAMAVLDKALVNKRRFRLGIQKTLLLKSSPQKIFAHFHCKSSQFTSTAIRLNIVWKEQKKQAAVTILLTDVAEVNWDHITSEAIRERHRISPLKTSTVPVKGPVKRIQQELREQRDVATVPSFENTANIQAKKAILSPAITRGSPPKTHTRGPPFVQQPLQPQCQETSLLGTQLVLPDKSLLEQYVQHKREALEQFHEEEGTIGGKRVSRGSATPAALVPPAGAIASFSAPNSKRNSQMLATAVAATEQLPPSLTSSYHSAIDGPIPDSMPQQQQLGMLVVPKLRRPQPMAALSTQTFEQPKSLFEEQMQRQAIQLRQRAVRQSLHEPSVSMAESQQHNQQDRDVVMRRRSSATEEATVAQPFVAQTQKPKQHEPSGRQSPTSTELANSGSLATASRQLDQVIDQARYRHNQHRNKFKEAIDYLDHIFEDFQREAESRSDKKATKLALQQKVIPKQKKQQSGKEQPRPPPKSEDIEPVQATFRQGSVKSAKEAFEKVAAAIASENNNKLRKQISAPSTSHQQKEAKVLRNKSQSKEQSSEIEEVEVAETIVLPTKNTADRLEFTKHWLTSGEVSVWAEGPSKRPDALLGLQMPLEECPGYESDEHSLGSCSAEVAAINAADERRQQQQQRQQKKNDTKGGPLLRHKQQPQPTKAQHGTANGAPPQIASMSTTANRPQLYRPQPQLGVLPSALGPQMHKVPSIEQLRLRTSQERAGSQDYQSMGSSLHSQQEGYGGFGLRPGCLSTHSLHRIGLNGGAFHSYTPTTSQQQLKGSIQSLPDSALCAPQAVPPPPGPNYPKAFPLQPSRQFATLARMDTHHQQQPRQVFPTHKQQQPAIPFQPKKHQQIAGTSTTAMLNEHTKAIDALVAELELNTDTLHCPTSDKRRSFPTMQTEVARTKGQAVDSQQQPEKSAMIRKIGKPLDELTELLLSESNKCGPTQEKRIGGGPMVQRKGPAVIGTSVGTMGGIRPFETINQEKLNPSKVDAMARMFDQPTGKTGTYFTSGPGSSGASQPWNRRTTAQGGRVPNNSKDKSEEQMVQKSVTNFARVQPTQNGEAQHHNYARNNDKNDKQNTQQLHPQQTSSRLYRRPVGGRVVRTEGPLVAAVVGRKDTPRMEEPEDNSRREGPNTYDNVRNGRTAHRPRPSPGQQSNDSVSLCSQDTLPPPPPLGAKTAGGRIGQLIRKLGSVGNGKPPTSAASMVSLNRVSIDSSTCENSKDGRNRDTNVGMVKSNSLSGEPWKCQVLAQQNGGRRMEDQDKHEQNGIGNRLKQTIFGGVVRRRVPS